MKRYLLMLFAATLLCGNIFADNKSYRLNAEYYLGAFYQRKYLENYKVTPIDYSSSGDMDNRPVSQAFDGDWYYVWQPDSPDKEQSITVTFNGEESISKIVYGLRERNPFADGTGYPQTIKVYSSSSEDGDDFRYCCSLQSEWSAEKLMFVFPEAVEGKRIKLLFEDIYSAAGEDVCVEVAELIFFKEDPAMDHVLKMFADEELLTLNEEYRNDALLDSVSMMIGDHMARNFLTERVERAKDILTGKITEETFPFPVKVYQKSGPDSEKYVMAFFPDKYTIFDKDKFFTEVGYHIEAIFEYEPFKSIRDKFNIYLVFTPSNESDYNYGYSTLDSRFGTYITNANDGGTTRLGLFTQSGRDTAHKMFDEFNEKYLDEGGSLRCANFVMNTASYGGSGHTFDKGVKGIIYTIGAGTDVLVHELGHAVANLSDEYCYAPYENVNQTAEPDGYKSKWAEFMGFRNVRHVSMCGGYYRPSAFCMMEYTGYNFCEVCKMALFETVDSYVADREEWYIADPIVYYNYENTYPNMLENINVFYGNGYKLQFRTVMKNLSDVEKNLVVDFKITSADGSEVRCEASNELLVEPSQLKSITATTADVASDIVEGDIIMATVKDKESGKILVDYATHKKEFGTVVTRYMVGNADVETNQEVMAPTTLKYMAGKEVKITPMDLSGYIYQKSSLDGTLTIEKDAVTEFTHYYIKSKGKVTLRLLDEDNNELQTIYRYVDYGEAFRPSQSDFPKRDGYIFILPTEEVIFDGINDMELTYTLAPEETSVCTPIKDCFSGIVVLQPNPNNGIFTLSLDNSYMGEVAIECYSLAGKMLKKEVVDKGDKTVAVPMRIDGYKGVAFVTVKCGDAVSTVKTIIE